MADRNKYLRYKRDERLLVCWITNKSKQTTSATTPRFLSSRNPLQEVTPSTLKALAELVGKYYPKLISAAILKLLLSTTRQELRPASSSKMSSLRTRILALKSNGTHLEWIKGLTEAFKFLGAEAWLSVQEGGSNTSDEDEKVLFENMFAILLSSTSTRQDPEKDEDGEG